MSELLMCDVEVRRQHSLQTPRHPQLITHHRHPQLDWGSHIMSVNQRDSRSASGMTNGCMRFPLSQK